jgi:Mycothiol maleylpyruvate isomerase N-terminal domain
LTRGEGRFQFGDGLVDGETRRFLPGRQLDDALKELPASAATVKISGAYYRAIQERTKGEVHMDQEGIENAYSAFVSALRRGGFSVPSDGWPAELVAAHVCLNNDLIAGVAEQVVAGEEPSYDNSAVVDEDSLRSFALSTGGLDALADATENSARRLSRAWAALDDKTGGYMVPARIMHAGSVIRDDPIPVREFIEGNATFHLDMHFGQLMALRA